MNLGVSDKEFPSRRKKVMSYSCMICSGDLLRHVSKDQIYWRCTTCHQEFSDAIATCLSSSISRLSENHKPKKAPSQSTGFLMCSYMNSTPQIQLVRIANIPRFFLEQAVLPGQRIIFVSVSAARLEIYTYGNVTAIADDSIPCEQLSITQVPHPKLTESKKMLMSEA
jgi:DNA-directed RNA polymerase subunit RPC12/RpoP